MSVGNHGMLHRRWQGLSDAELAQEIIAAKGELERAVRHKVVHAACPFGSYDRRSLKLLRSESYEIVYTSDGGSSNARAWLQPRRSIQATDSPEALSAYLDRHEPGHKRLTRSVKGRLKRWR